MDTQDGIAAVAWSPYCQRTTQYAQRLNARLYQIHFLQWKRPLLAPVKYVPQCLKTWTVLSRQRPSVIYVAVSPAVAALSVFAYCRYSGAKFIMDVHGHSLNSWKWAWSVPLQRALARLALVNIVDQDRYRRLFESWGARVLVLERPPLNIPFERLKPVPAPNPFNVTVINSFNSDEPLDPVLKAATQLPEIRFSILGDRSRAKKEYLRSTPQNVVFPGYLRGDAYWNQLYASSAVMALTTHPYSLLGGAQEGMGLGKPLILSNQPALVEYFTKGTLFVDHSVESIVDGVRKVEDQESCLVSDIAELAVEKRQRWESVFQELLGLIQEAGGNHCKASQSVA